jgi:hypothetical protein
MSILSFCISLCLREYEPLESSIAAKHVSIFDNAMVFYHGGKQRSEDEFEFEALSKSSGFSGFHFSGCLPCQQWFGPELWNFTIE